MTSRQDILDEIKRIPDEKLDEVLNAVRKIRHDVENSRANAIMKFAGIWSDMKDEEFETLLKDIRERRNAAFLTRGNERNLD